MSNIQLYELEFLKVFYFVEGSHIYFWWNQKLLKTGNILSKAYRNTPTYKLKKKLVSIVF